MKKQISDKEYQDVLEYIEEDEFLKTSTIDRKNIDDIIAIRTTLAYQAWALSKAWREVGKAITNTKEYKFIQKFITCLDK